MVLSTAILYIRSPVSLVLLASIFLGGLWLIAPVDFVFQGQDIVVIQGLCLFLLLLLGLFLGFGSFKSTKIYIVFEVSKVRRIVSFLSLLGAIGLAVRLVERVVIRGGGALSTDFIANRELIAAGSGNGAVALIGGIFSTFLLFLPFYLLLLKRLGGWRNHYFLLYMLSAIYPLTDVLIQGSRSTFIIYLAILILSIFTFCKVRAGHVFFGIIIFVVLAWGAAQIFILRTEQMGLGAVASMYLSGYSYFAPASQEIIDYLSKSDLQGWDVFIYSFVHVSQYLLHGIYEFLYIASNVESPTTNGSMTFYIPFKIAASLFGVSEVESLIASDLLRPGVYSTLFGPWLYDFGVYGAFLASALFGFGVGIFARLVRRGNTALFPIYFILLGFIPFCLVVNLYISGTGQYAILGALFLWVVFSSEYFNPKFKC